MVISLENARPFYSEHLPSLFKASIEASSSPYAHFAFLCRLSLSQVVRLLIEARGTDRINPYYKSDYFLSKLEGFKLGEFFTGLHTDSSFTVLDQSVYNMVGRAVLFAQILNQVRDNISSFFEVRTAISISSGYRTINHNASVGGVDNSNHLSGFAVDVACPKKVSMDVFKNLVCRVLDSYQGFLFSKYEFIPYYKKGFVHISL